MFRTTSELVLVDAQVMHKKTKAPTGSLRKEDFQIYEDGVLQEIKFFGRDQLPLFIDQRIDKATTTTNVKKWEPHWERRAL